MAPDEEVEDDGAGDDVDDKALGFAAHPCGAAGNDKTFGMTIGSMGGGEPPEPVNASGGPMPHPLFVAAGSCRAFSIKGIAADGKVGTRLAQIPDHVRGTICRVPGKD